MKRILFVDDEKNILDGVRRLLYAQRDQWDMHFALSGEAALEECEHCSFDVVVSDLRMPGMDGVELLTLLAARQCRSQIVLMSGVGGQVLTATDQFGQRLGLSIAGHLRKPFRLAELESIIARTSDLALAATPNPHPSHASSDSAAPPTEPLSLGRPAHA